MLPVKIFPGIGRTSFQASPTDSLKPEIIFDRFCLQRRLGQSSENHRVSLHVLILLILCVSCSLFSLIKLNIFHPGIGCIKHVLLHDYTKPSEILLLIMIWFLKNP